jgi:WD40 repeat protein
MAAAVSVDIDSPQLIATVCKSKSLHSIQRNQTMATNPTKKRHKSGAVELAASHSVGYVIDAILNVDREAFKEHARTLDWGAFALLLNHLAELRQDMESTLASLSDIPPLVIASNVFPYLENRTDWNNFALVNKDINYAVTNHKQLEPPWPEGELWDESVDDDTPIKSPTFSPDCDFIANGDLRGNICLWNRNKGFVAKWLGREDIVINYFDNEDEDLFLVSNVSFSPNGNLLASVATFQDSSIIKIWDLADDNRCLQEWTQVGDVPSVAFSPGGNCIATLGRMQTVVYLRNVSDGTTTRLITPALEAAYAMAFSPDGRTLALGGRAGDGRSGSVELWKLYESEDTSFSLEGHLWSVNNLDYSPDGTLLASASGDDTIRLWDVASGQCVRTFLGHTDDVISISFSPDGNFLASGGNDQTIRLWTVASGDCIESLNQTGGAISTVDFSRHGRMLLTEEGGDVRLRRMDTETLEELNEERDNLMKLSRDQLQQALTENNITFEPVSSSKTDLTDLLVNELDREERIDIVASHIPTGE